MTRLSSNPWTQQGAISWCVELEKIACKYGGHVALTGGTLYKQGARKDLDIVIYRSADEAPFDWAGFFGELQAVTGVKLVKDFGYCKKAITEDHSPIEFFDPFAVGGHSGSDVPDTDLDKPSEQVRAPAFDNSDIW